MVGYLRGIRGGTLVVGIHHRRYVVDEAVEIPDPTEEFLAQRESGAVEVSDPCKLIGCVLTEAAEGTEKPTAESPPDDQ